METVEHKNSGNIQTNANGDYIVPGTITVPDPTAPQTGTGDQWLYTQINKDDLGESDEYEINFEGKLVEARAIETEGISLESFLTNSNIYNETQFTEFNDKYQYYGTKKSMVKFE